MSAPAVSAVILSFNRRTAIERVLDILGDLPFDEVIVYDGGSVDGTLDALARREGDVKVITGPNLGAAGRNVAVEAARNELVVMLDDDSYPLPGAVEKLRAGLMADPDLAVAAGLVRDVDMDGNILRHEELGTFDWFFRNSGDGSGRRSIFFFPEGACMIRKTPFLEAGGFFPGYFIAASEVDLTTRLIAKGYEVAYVRDAIFDHLKAEEGRVSAPVVLRYRVRNQIWYFYRHFPLWLVALRVPAYLLFDLIECAAGGALNRWVEGVKEAWTERNLVKGTRRPLPRSVIRRAESNRGRLHMRLLWGQLARRARRVVRRGSSRREEAR